MVAREHPLFGLHETPAAAPPAWLDPVEHPFASHFVEIEDHRVHYIDEERVPRCCSCTRTRCGRSSFGHDPATPANRAAMNVLRRWHKPLLTAFGH